MPAMIGSRHHRLFVGAGLLATAILAAEGALLAVSRRSANRAARVLEKRSRECHALTAGNPAPTPAQTVRIEAELAQARASLQALEFRLGWAGAAAAGPPASPTDAFFDLTGFVRLMEAKAARAEVGVKAGERFGFSAYVHDGPPPALLAAIDRQRRMATTLLEALFAAHPDRLDGVLREGPKDPPAATRDRDSPDFFAMDPRWSLGAAGVVEATAFRVAFSGHSAALRHFLNRLAAADLPMVVRGVAVEPAGESSPARPVAASAPPPLAPLVRPVRSRFLVTVECWELIGASPRPGDSPPPVPVVPDPGGSWPEPQAQPRGREWLYDLFTPPAIFWDPRGPTLRAAAPADPMPAGSAGRPPDLELLQVRRGVFRVQLVGYAGGPDGLRGIFADAASGETVIGRGGERLAGSQVTVRRLRLDRRQGEANGDTAEREAAAIAVVVEDGTDREIELTTRGPCLAGAPVGLFGSRCGREFRREARAGESFMLNGASYCVEQIDLQPPQAVVACAPSAGAGPPIRTVMAQSSPTDGATPPGPPPSGRDGADLPFTP
jgi:hypothetical protein